MSKSYSRHGAHFSLLALLLVLLAACDNAPAAPVMPANIAPPPTWPSITPTTRQTIDGITVGIQPLQADARRVIIGVSIDGPAKSHVYNIQVYSVGTEDALPILSLADGTKLTWSESTSSVYGSPSPAGQPFHSEGVLEFYTSGLHADSSMLAANLRIPLIIDNNPFVPPSYLPTSVIPVTDTPTSIPLPTEPPSLSTFSFSTDLPFDSRETVAQVNQTVESNGVAMTLEQADVTATEARLTLRYAATKSDSFLQGDDWRASGFLSFSTANSSNPTSLIEETEDEEYPAGHGCYASSTNPCILSYLGLPYPDKGPVDATLTLSADRASPTDGPTSGYQPYGTWTFHFTIPVSTK